MRVTPKNLLIHRRHHAAGVAVRQVAIPFDHLQRLVAKHSGNLDGGGAIHGQIRRGTVAQVMKTKIVHLGLAQCRCPGLGQVYRMIDYLAIKHKIGI